MFYNLCSYRTGRTHQFNQGIPVILRQANSECLCDGLVRSCRRSSQSEREPFWLSLPITYCPVCEAKRVESEVPRADWERQQWAPGRLCASTGSRSWERQPHFGLKDYVSDEGILRFCGWLRRSTAGAAASRGSVMRLCSRGNRKAPSAWRNCRSVACSQRVKSACASRR